MEIDPQKIYAVISGDIIGSSKLPPTERAELLEMMKQASHELRVFLGQSVPLSVDIYAGDSWQLLVSEPAEALRAAVFYRSSIIAATGKKVDTRLVVALGKVDFVPAERASEGDGEAFRLSGRVLKEVAGKQQMRFAANEIHDSDQWDATFGLIDVVLKRWSAKQAQAALGALQGWSHAEIAAHCKPPIEREGATRLLAAARSGERRKTYWPTRTGLDTSVRSFVATNGGRFSHHRQVHLSLWGIKGPQDPHGSGIHHHRHNAQLHMGPDGCLGNPMGIKRDLRLTAIFFRNP